MDEQNPCLKHFLTDRGTLDRYDMWRILMKGGLPGTLLCGLPPMLSDTNNRADLALMIMAFHRQNKHIQTMSE